MTPEIVEGRYGAAEAAAKAARKVVRDALVAESNALLDQLLKKSVKERLEELEKPNLKLIPGDRRKLVRSLQKAAPPRREIVATMASRLGSTAIGRGRPGGVWDLARLSPEGEYVQLGAGGVQQLRELRFGKAAERRRTFPAKGCRQAGFVFQRQRQFRDWGIEHIFQRQPDRRTLDFGLGTLNVFPDNVQNDVFKIRILVVAVCPPAAGLQINFHIAGNRLFRFKL